MTDNTIVLPSKPRIVLEEGFKGIYEIDGLHPGYGFTLGNSLRRIVLSSLPGAAVTSIKIAGIDHEFQSIAGIKEDAVTIMLNIKKLRLRINSNEPQILSLKVKGINEVTGKMIDAPGQVEILNPDLVIATVTDKNTELNIDFTVEQGLGFVTRDAISKSRVDIGTIALDANFTPIKRASYEVENMRVGDRTDFNRLRITIETDGTFTPHEALSRSIEIMINQLKAIVGFEEKDFVGLDLENENSNTENSVNKPAEEMDSEFLKTRIESVDLSSRTLNALTGANIRTVGGLARKKEKDILEIEGLGAKGVAEIKRVLGEHGITLK
ncbi:MAG TPA: DNA-directed RNA polymerase subunit alpha [Candidatus Paceibacterota bacterium]